MSDLESAYHTLVKKLCVENHELEQEVQSLRAANKALYAEQQTLMNKLATQKEIIKAKAKVIEDDEAADV